MENLIGDNVVTEKKKEKGIEKHIYFSEIDCPSFEQFGMTGNKNVNLLEILKRIFDDKQSYFNGENFSFICENKKYLINIIDSNEKYYFGKISTEKEYNDLLEEYKVDDENTKKSIIIKSFTFFYIDIKRKSLVYIGHKNLKNMNKIFTKIFTDYSHENVIVNYYGDKELLEKIVKSVKLQSIEFEMIDDGEIAKSLDKSLSWDRNVESYIVNVKIKKPSKHYVEKILKDKHKREKISKPVLKFQDELFNETISHLFEQSFSIKDVILIDEIDIVKFEKIKTKLIDAMNKYMR